jgi:DNA-binding transcriptional regulator YdaS (Cro superfamily)
MLSPAQKTMFVRAVKVCGGEQALADRLGVPEEDLAGWIAGKAIPSTAAYTRVAELVRKAGIDALKS